MNDINWGYNCLTAGVHHGRPEALWNLPLLYARRLFKVDELQSIVVTRIYNDAMVYVSSAPIAQEGFEDLNTSTEEWAEKTRSLAQESFVAVLNGKIDELNEYYDTKEWRLATYGVIKRIKKDKLNPGYQPLHPHDSINKLCRILGTSSSIEASKEKND